MNGNARGAHWHAVIDIGSNSVRLVIYDVGGSALVPHYNEKVMARLGAGLAETGYLSPAGIDLALKALGRYKAIVDGLHVTRVRAVATAAVRVARDGAAFVARVEREIGLRVDTISGREEARLSAQGVAGGVHDANGLVGDLGGSSLEFARLEKGKVKEGETLMLGPLSVDYSGQKDNALKKTVRNMLQEAMYLPGHGGRFYMVGGAWRALAKLHMNVTEYPLRQLHAYVLDKRAMMEIDKAVQRTDPAGLSQLASASERRQKVLPYANFVLQELFEIGGFKDVMISSYGLREGVILNGLSKTGRGGKRTDPLLEGAALFVRLQDQRREFGEALYDWVKPVITPMPDLFGQIDLDMRLLAAACLLADAGTRFHPNKRADLAYDQVLNGPYTNVTHPERAFIALSVAYRYSRHFRPSHKTDTLLDKRQIRLARLLGAAMQLGSVYSGRSAKVLRQSRLAIEGHQVSLFVPKDQSAMVSDAVERYLRTLANQMDLKENVSLY